MALGPTCPALDALIPYIYKKPLEYLILAAFSSFRLLAAKTEPLRDWRRSSVLLHMLLIDLGQRCKFGPSAEKTIESSFV